MGCGLCANLSPDIFGFDGKAILIGGREMTKDVFEVETENVIEAEKTANICPVSAIIISE